MAQINMRKMLLKKSSLPLKNYEMLPCHFLQHFFLFFLFYPRSDLFDHLFQQRFAFLFRFCVDVMRFAFTLGVGGGVASFVQMIIDLIDSSGAGFADLAFLCLKIGPNGPVFFFGGFRGLPSPKTPRLCRFVFQCGWPPAAAWRP